MFKAFVISTLLVAGGLWSWQFTDGGSYNCHCYAWHPADCKCHDSVFPAGAVPINSEDVQVGDLVTYSYGPNGRIKHSAVYVGNGWCEGKLGSLPVIDHPLSFAFPYGTHYQCWRFTPNYERKWQ